MKPDKNQGSDWNLLRRYGNLGIEMVVSLLIGAWGGHSLDEWLGTSPWFLLLGFFLGAAAGFLSMLRLIASGQGRKKEKEKE